MILPFLYSFQVFAQLGFCEGSKGDPIFHEDFGTGNSSGPALPSSVTSYTYVTGDPQDGQYTISNRIGQNNGTWHSNLPTTTISRGRALIVNADFTSGRFYRTEISGLCENTTYEFSAFLMNIYDRSETVCENGGIPVNVRFEIWDETDTVILKEGSTGNITSTTSPVWEEYALTFQTVPGQETVILKMFNNGAGGCGNDLAIDDIIFRSCGDLTEVAAGETMENSYSVCREEAPVSITLTASPDYSVYTHHAFQWQESEDNDQWTDLPGETGETYTTAALTTSRYYRVKVAEDEVNLSNNFCSSASEAFFIEIFPTPDAPESEGDVIICGNEEARPLRVLVAANETVNWYDRAQGGSLLSEGSPSYLPPAEGKYYAEAVRAGESCEPGPRTAVSLISNAVPEVEDEILNLCNEGSITLNARLPNMDYVWNTGETTESITVTTIGNFSVTLVTEDGCRVVKNFEVNEVDVPVIGNIISEENDVIINVENPGDFQYSLDGINFQASGTFTSVPGGVYTAYVADLQQCETVTREFPHVVVPRYITPNNDGYNDHFELKGMQYFERSEIKIFDRYGKLLVAGRGENFMWNGTFNGRDLPADDYWYEIIIEGYGQIKGNFSLIR